MFEVNVVIAEVGGEVHTEADAHDEVDQGDAVQDDVPDCHEAQASYKSVIKNLCFIQDKRCYPRWKEKERLI